MIRVSQAVGIYHDPQTLFYEIADGLHRVIDFDSMVISLGAGAARTVWLSAGGERRSIEIIPLDIPASEDLLLQVFERQEAVAIPRLDGEKRFAATVDILRKDGMQSLCALPLSTVHRRLGSIAMASRHPDAYNAEEVRFLGLTASFVATAIDNALNFRASRDAEEALRERNERLRLLLEINNTLVANLGFRDLLRAITVRLRSLMNCDGVGVTLPDPRDGSLRVFAVHFPERPELEEEEQLVEADSPMALVFASGEVFTTFDETGVQGDSVAARAGIRASLHLPLEARGRRFGVLTLARTGAVAFEPRDIEFMGLVASQIAIAIENALAFQEIAALKDRLAHEKVYLVDEIRSERNFDRMVGRSAALKKVLQQIEIVAPTDSNVLINGETGTGKELIARAIHDLSARAKNAFVKLNCAAIPTGLLESELFGHERGAFTGAVAQRIGRFELADRGTVFLDEIGEIAPEVQPKMLRVLQEREFERLGSSRTLRTDARLIAATNRDLAAMVREQKFRSDLYYRLNVFPIQAPPLRERAEDIPLLVRHFVQQYARRMNRSIDTIPSDAMSALVRYPWPGNIRELQNVIERAVILSTGPVLQVPTNDLQTLAPAVNRAADAPRSAAAGATLEEVERRHILETLDTAGWVIAGPKGAAALLGLKRSTLQARMEKLGIRRARTAETISG